MFFAISKPLSLYRLSEFMAGLSDSEREIVSRLRELILEELPEYSTEKLTGNSLRYAGYGEMIVIIPSTAPGSGLMSGVLLAFWNRIAAANEDYLINSFGSGMQFRLIHSLTNDDENQIRQYIRRAVMADSNVAEIETYQLPFVPAC